VTTGLLLVLLPLLVLGGALVAARPQPAASLPPGLVGVQRMTARWRTGGLAVGVVVAVVSAQVDSLGRGVMLAGSLLALCIVLGVVVGELRVTAPPPAERVATLEVRRVRDYAPRRLAIVVLAATALLGAVLAATTAMGSADDLGRDGRVLFRQCSDLVAEARGPWPGSFYSVPLAVVVGLGLLVTAVALRQVVRRPRQGTDVVADDLLRRRAAETCTAAAGLLVVVPLTGIATFTALGLRGISCAPAGWTASATGLLLLVPLLLGVAAWCAGLLLGRALTPATVAA
jgi:hypothetical protein